MRKEEIDRKVMTAEQAVSRFVPDGACMAIGGFVTNRRLMRWYGRSSARKNGIST